MLELVRVRAGPARVLDLLLPCRDLSEAPWKLPVRAPEVDLEGERVLARTLLDHPLQRCVRDETPIPVVFALDLGRRKARRQRAARHHVLRADLVRAVIEIDEVAGAHVYSADAEAHFARIDAVEIDQPF